MVGRCQGIINEVLEVFGEALNKSRKPCLKRESSEAQRGAAERGTFN